MNRFERRAAKSMLKTKNKVKAKTKKLMGFYWGYKANHIDGFEFTHLDLEKSGMNIDTALEIGNHIKQACERQVADVFNGNTPAEVGLTKDEFLKHEQDRLVGAVEEYNNIAKSGCNFAEVLPLIIVICSAISILVAAGIIKQDEYNGDSFLTV
jgi:hypothetical protein